MSDTIRIGFLGAGKMATALAQGWIQAGLTNAKNVCASDPVASAREHFTKTTSAAAFADNPRIVTQSEIVVLAVKPQNMADLLREVQPSVTAAHLVISIAAGITIEQIASSLGVDRRIIRVMPNTPCLVGASASAFSASSKATAADLQTAERLLGSVGRAVQVPEKLLDAVTGLSGSGPAFVYYLAEALAEGGRQAGLQKEEARRLAYQTLRGAVGLLQSTGLTPEQLIAQVVSKGGTTEAGLKVLAAAKVADKVSRAVARASRRATEIKEQNECSP